MAFQPPELPFDVGLPAAKVHGWVRLTFASAALVCLGLSILATSAARSHVWVPVLLCGAVLCGLFAFRRLKTSLATDGITIRGRTHSYSDIRYVEASFMSLNVGQVWPQLTLDIVGAKPMVILTRGLAIDSLTLQRTLLWAMAGGEAGRRRRAVNDRRVDSRIRSTL
jgi:hypothetical protein